MAKRQSSGGGGNALLSPSQKQAINHPFNPQYRPLNQKPGMPTSSQFQYPKGATVGIKRFKKGGKVKKTGPAILHKGERVLNRKQTKKYDKKKKFSQSKFNKTRMSFAKGN
jgi:hypothetical protein